MPIADKNTWESTLLSMCPPVGEASAGMQQVVDWMGFNMDLKYDIQGISPLSQFTLNRPVLKTALLAKAVPTGDIAAAASNWFDAIEEGIKASTMVVSPGMSSPSGTWAVVTSCLVDEQSFPVAKQVAVAYMVSTPITAEHPVIAEATRKYVLALTYSTRGFGPGTPPPPVDYLNAPTE